MPKRTKKKDRQQTAVIKSLRETKAKFEESTKEVLDLMSWLEEQMFITSQMEALTAEQRIILQKNGHPLKEDGDDLIF